jgi:hypothetical protein
VADLLEYATHEARLSKRNKAGESLRDTLEAVERMTGRMPAEGLNPVDDPDLLWDLWQHFLRLGASRTAGAMTANPISELEIWAFCRLRGLHLERWELDAIRRLDAIALSNKE